MKIHVWASIISLLACTSVQAAPRIVFLGDSLTEGYGVPKDKAYPALVEKKLKQSGLPGAEVVNAGISGSTSASGESRLKWHLKNKPEVLVLALGANDGLRGLKIEETSKNLARVIESAKDAGIQVVLAGMRLPPNYGKEYAAGFERMYRDLAKKHGTSLIPFLLQGVGGESALNQEDGIHPNEKGHERMAETVAPHLLKLLASKARK